MTKSKNTKRALLVSVLSMLLCLTMLIGSTFAWFTDTVEAGSSKIIAGNLKVDLLAKGTLTPADGETPAKFEYGKGDQFESIANVDDALFGADILWEPGQVYTRELQVENKGSLAVKYNVFIPMNSIMYNEVLDPVYEKDEDENRVFDEETGEPVIEDFENTYVNLMYAIKVGYYDGSLDELKGEIGELTRENVLQAVKDGTIKQTQDNNADGSNNGWLAGHDAVKSVLLTGELDPKTGNEKVTKDFTLIAYWAPEEEIVSDWGDLAASDDAFNLKNDRRATVMVNNEDVLDGYYAGGYTLDNTKTELSLEFDIGVIATQNPYESDSFDENYDADAYDKLGDTFNGNGKYKANPNNQ